MFYATAHRSARFWSRSTANIAWSRRYPILAGLDKSAERADVLALERPRKRIGMNNALSFRCFRQTVFSDDQRNNDEPLATVPRDLLVILVSS